MRVGIIGSRRRNEHSDEILIEKELLKLIEKNKDIEIVSGGCKTGGDKFAENLAKKYNLKITLYLADWKKYGKAAGFIRNDDIAKNSDILIACVADDRKGGTEDTIRKFEKLNLIDMVIII